MHGTIEIQAGLMAQNLYPCMFSKEFCLLFVYPDIMEEVPILALHGGDTGQTISDPVLGPTDELELLGSVQ